MVRFFFVAFSVLFGFVGIWSLYWPPILWSLLVLIPLFLMGVMDAFQKRQGIRRNFPLLGNLRYFFEFIRPELQQYFVENNHDGRPIPREFRSIIYQRAKQQRESLPFGTQRNVYAEQHEWIHHSMQPQTCDPEAMRVWVGQSQCRQPYLASRFNISAMSYGSLSKNAVMALNLGAAQGGFYHNTGEGGLTPYHLKGGDLVWQIGTGYFGCRTAKGEFCPDSFATKSQNPQVKMIEIKISQGAKPGKGGLLPASKVSPEIAQIRGVPMGEDVISPSQHSAFSNPVELMEFLANLRELSGGKPVGIKMCIGKKREFVAICRAMLKTGLRPDFITVDGAEGGTGAAPLEFSNSVGAPLEEGLVFVHDILTGFDLRKEITVIASGKVFTSFHLLTKLALGADMVNSARGMMLALGCIQALRCNSNHCPTGVATNDPQLVRGLHVPTKAERVANYQMHTLAALSELVGAMGYVSPSEIKREDVYRRVSNGEIRTFESLFPSVDPLSLLDLNHLPKLPQDTLSAVQLAQAEAF